MTIYLGTAKPCGSSSGGDATLTVINKSSSAVKKGDKVWISEGKETFQNFDVSGYPTIDEETKVVSGFSANDYIKLIKPFNPENNTWEIKLKFTTGAVPSTNGQSIFHSKPSNNRYGIGLWVRNTGEFNYFWSYNGSSWGADLFSTFVCAANTLYWIKFGWTGSEYYLDISTDGKEFERIITQTSTTPIYNQLSTTNIGIYDDNILHYEFLGSIDLSETYIKINDELWWTPFVETVKTNDIIDYKEVTSSSFNGLASEDIAVGTKVANVENGGTEVDGIMSTYVANETKSDLITVYRDKPFEGVFKIKASEWASNSNHFIRSEPNFFYVRGGSSALWSVFKFASSEDYTKTSFSSLEWIYLKIAYNSNMISWAYSTDGKRYTSLKTVTGSSTFLDNFSKLSFNLCFGCRGTDTYPTWNGQIDFNESYFRVDGETVWSGIKYINGGSGLVKVNV